MSRDSGGRTRLLVLRATCEHGRWLRFGMLGYRISSLRGTQTGPSAEQTECDPDRTHVREPGRSSRGTLRISTSHRSCGALSGREGARPPPTHYAGHSSEFDQAAPSQRRCRPIGGAHRSSLCALGANGHAAIASKLVLGSPSTRRRPQKPAGQARLRRAQRCPCLTSPKRLFCSRGCERQYCGGASTWAPSSAAACHGHLGS